MNTNDKVNETADAIKAGTMTFEQGIATMLNPDVAAGASLNTKPVTKARSKAGAHGKSKAKVAKATTAKATSKPAKAAGKAVKAAPQVDPYTASYNMKAWREKLWGPAPTREHIVTAHALGATKGFTKQLLAVAAYLRPCAGDYSCVMIGHALEAVCPTGSPDVKLNVVNDRLLGMTPRPVELLPNTKGIDGKKSYALVLTKAGQRMVERYRADKGMPTANTDHVMPHPDATVTADAGLPGYEPGYTPADALPGEVL